MQAVGKARGHPVGVPSRFAAGPYRPKKTHKGNRPGYKASLKRNKSV